MQVAIDSMLHSPITLLSVREEVWMTSHLTNCGSRRGGRREWVLVNR